jgi:hypothetical protein
MTIVGVIGFALLLMGGVSLAVMFAIYGEEYEDKLKRDK